MVCPIPNTLKTFVLEQDHLESVKTRLLAGLSFLKKKKKKKKNPL